jgi:hypothetical protein
MDKCSESFLKRRSYAVAPKPILAFGRAVLYLSNRFSFLRSASAKTKNDKVESTMLPQAIATSEMVTA